MTHFCSARRPHSDKLLYFHEVNHRETKTPSPPSLKPYCPRRHYYIIYSPSGDESRVRRLFSTTPLAAFMTHCSSTRSHRLIIAPLFFSFLKRSLIAARQIISLRRASLPHKRQVIVIFFNDIELTPF